MQTMVDDEKREVIISSRFLQFMTLHYSVQLLFLYKLVDGVATGSFGTHVANLAGVPLDVVTRAETISKDFAKQFNEKQARKKVAMPVTTQADFAYLVKLATSMSLDSDATKTKETLSILKRSVKQM
jgi:DNA mismatch repair protein MSH6